jgi:hypothetical protein
MFCTKQGVLAERYLDFFLPEATVAKIILSAFVMKSLVPGKMVTSELQQIEQRRI